MSFSGPAIRFTALPPSSPSISRKIGTTAFRPPPPAFETSLLLYCSQSFATLLRVSAHTASPAFSLARVLRCFVSREVKHSRTARTSLLFVRTYIMYGTPWAYLHHT